MAITVTIPLVTLPLGLSIFGPAAIAVGSRSFILDLDQTVGLNPLNSAALSTTIDLYVDISYDGGVSWPTWVFGSPPTGQSAIYNGSGILLATLAFHAHAIGGTHIDDETGQTMTHLIISMPVFTIVTAAMARVRLTVAGAVVTISGSLTIN